MTIPSNPKSGAQNDVRTIMGFCSAAWARSLTPAEQQTWAQLAADTAITGMNAMIGENLRRFSQGKLPIATPNPPAAPTDGIWIQLPQAVGHVRSIQWDWDLAIVNDAWGLLFFAALQPTTVPGAGTLRTYAVLLASGVDATTLTQLEAGTYDTAVIVTAKDGEALNFSANGGVIVT